MSPLCGFKRLGFALSFQLLAFSYPVFGVKLSRPLEKKTFSGEKQKAVDVQLFSYTDNGLLQKIESPVQTPLKTGFGLGFYMFRSFKEAQILKTHYPLVRTWGNAELS